MTDTRLTAALPPLPNLQNASIPSRTNATGASPSAIEETARAQANEFEATFLASILQPIFEGLAKDRTFGGGFGEEAFTGLLTQEYAKSITEQANLGIADQVYEQLIKVQETTPAVVAPANTTAAPGSNTLDSSKAE